MDDSHFTTVTVPKIYRLLDAQGTVFDSTQKGALGGYRKLRIYGRLDCYSALRHISNGHYVSERVFFLDEQAAINAGYRPCAKCMKPEYKAWKQNKATS